MEIKRLQQFLAVIDAGSITEAARNLRITQGALSLNIQALERELGSSLFDRSLNGMTPNEVGRALEARARTISNETDRAQRDVRELLGMERGQVIVGTAAYFTDLVLPRAIMRFQEAFPSIELCVIDGYITTLISEVKTGGVDFALSTLPRQVTTDPELAHKAYLQVRPIQIYASASNPLTAQRRITVRDLVSCPWLMPTRSDFFRVEVEQLFAKAGQPAPRVTVAYTSVGMAKRLICEGPYISFFSQLVVRDEIDRGLIKPLRVPELRWRRTAAAGAFFRRGRTLSPAAARLIDVVGETTREIMR